MDFEYIRAYRANKAFKYRIIKISIGDRFYFGLCLNIDYHYKWIKFFKKLNMITPFDNDRILKW
jgi:hypothetical protein